MERGKTSKIYEKNNPNLKEALKPKPADARFLMDLLEWEKRSSISLDGCKVDEPIKKPF